MHNPDSLIMIVISCIFLRIIIFEHVHGEFHTLIHCGLLYKSPIIFIVFMGMFTNTHKKRRTHALTYVRTYACMYYMHVWMYILCRIYIYIYIRYMYIQNKSHF